MRLANSLQSVGHCPNRRAVSSSRKWKQKSRSSTSSQVIPHPASRTKGYLLLWRVILNLLQWARNRNPRIKRLAEPIWRCYRWNVLRATGLLLKTTY
ncbi:hypothetical protein C5167_035726 [Papaver somniferum]|nr:hypothetical protein C5167_035726 [Papaver somniferum]